jgi:hypothetical protein
MCPELEKAACSVSAENAKMEERRFREYCHEIDYFNVKLPVGCISDVCISFATFGEVIPSRMFEWANQRMRSDRHRSVTAADR